MISQKKCNKCNTLLLFSNFHKSKACKFGLRNVCKECKKKEDTIYLRSEKGLLNMMYSRQKANSKQRGMNPPTYTKEEFISFCYKNNFKGIYENWVKNGFKKFDVPSIDRLDDLKTYSFDNIRLVTWKENKQKATEDSKKGIGTQGKRCKKIIKLDSNYNIVCEYPSYREARRNTNYDISPCLKIGSISKTGHYWRYA